jgi:hypothetical protein
MLVSHHYRICVLILLVIGCSSTSEPTPPRPQASTNQNFGSSDSSNNNNGSQSTGTGNGSSSNSSNCTNSVSPGAISGSTSSNTSLALLAAVTYESKIKSLISIHCSGCHGNPTDGKPNLSTWSGVQSKSRDIVSTTGSGDIVHSSHNGINLSSQDKADFDAWAQGGYLEVDSSGSSSATPSPSGSPSSSNGTDNCVNNSGSATNNNESLLRPQKMLDCNGQGLVFDRKANISKPLAEQTCTSFKLGNWCTEDGIISQFGASGSAVKTRMTDLKSQGYQIDQCGEDGSARFVYMVKEEQKDGNPQLNITILRPKS